MIPVLFTSLIVLTSNVNADESKIVNVDIVLGAAKVDNTKFYNPGTVSIEAGTTVSWMNIDKDPHTVTDGTPNSKWGKIFDSGLMRQGKEYRYTFDEPGTYQYLCALHPWMYGKVIVENPVKSLGITIIQKLNVFIKSEQQSYGEDEIVRLTVDVLGAGNRPTDPDTIDAQLSTVNADERKQVNVNRIDVGKYAFSAIDLKPASYTLSVKASKDGFEPGYSMLTIHVVKKEVEKTIPEPPLPTISVAVDKIRYNVGDTVTLSGKVLNAVQNKSVIFEVVDPTDNLYTRGQAELKSDGTFEWFFKVANIAPVGTWTIKTKFADQAATASFEIEKLDVATAPEPVKQTPISNLPVTKFIDEKVTIARSLITDQTNTQLSNVDAGQLMMIQSLVRNNQEIQQTFAYIVQIKDSNGIVVKLEAVEGLLPSGKSFTIGVSWTPESAGTYSAEAFVWKSLKEPVPLSLNLLKTSFAVTN
jgi:plastocyanin